MSSLRVISESEVASISNRFNFEVLKGQRILITGGTGLVGRYLVSSIILCTRFLKNEAPEVTVVSKSKVVPNLFPHHGTKFDHIQMDISEQIPRGNFDILIHAASPASPDKYTSLDELKRINTFIFENIMCEMKNLKSILFLSTSEVYGKDAPVGVAEDFKGRFDSTELRSYYPIAKLHTENFLLSTLSASINVKIARLFHSFGPGIRKDDVRTFSNFIFTVAQGRLPILLSSGSQIRTFLYLEDTVVGLLKLLSSNYSRPVNIGSEIPFSILDFAKLASEIAGLRGKIQKVTDKGSLVLSPNFALVPNSSLLKSLGWTQEVQLESAISRTLEWVRQGALPPNSVL